VSTLAGHPAGATPKIRPGVSALKAGQGNSFLWRRLHSLSGIFPVGAFLTEHFVSNMFATKGWGTPASWAAYNKQVAALTGLPLLFLVELCFIYIPLLYHSLYGFYIWYRGNSNVGEYTYVGNWVYTTQRWTGGIAFFYMAYHTATMRFMGPHIVTNPDLAFWKVQNALVGHPGIVVLYAIGVIAAAWHFGAGLFLFTAKWGIFTGEQARERFGKVCVAITLLFVLMGLASLGAFLSAPVQPMPANAEQAVLNQ
jgi:succinate dehydrogenase / fumarate reductase, cytochrome b subunit